MPVEIREHIESDFESYHEWQSDPAMASFVSWLPKTRAQSKEDLQDAIMQQHAKPRLRYFFAIMDSHSEKVVGSVGFTVVEDGVGDCGWFIRRGFWGKGYATEAARQLVAVAFGKAGLWHLKASCARGGTSLPNA